MVLKFKETYFRFLSLSCGFDFETLLYLEFRDASRLPRDICLKSGIVPLKFAQMDSLNDLKSKRQKAQQYIAYPS
jgi:hypothetical protein